MITRSDLARLAAINPQPGVSLFMPTHRQGDETRQGPVVLKNLVADARQQLLMTGADQTEADSILAPAAALIDDSRFWQHRDLGLALFLSADEASEFTLPEQLPESVAVGPYFRIRPLLPLVAADGDFHVLTVTEARIGLYKASRYTMTALDNTGLPPSLAEPVDPDYENPVQASPVARPHTGTIDISRAQVYGASPPDWRKTRLVESVRRLAAAVDRYLAGHRTSVVLIAGAEIAGHFQKFTQLDLRLAGTIEVNPESLDDVQLRKAAYDFVASRFEADQRIAVERFTALLGSHDPRAAATAETVQEAAAQGRVETLLLPAEEVRDGRAPAVIDASDAAVALTLRHGGDVYVVSDLPAASRVAAILRY